MQASQNRYESDEDKNIQEFLNKYGKAQVLQKFDNDQIFQSMKQRGLNYFLLHVKASQLRFALEIKEELEKENQQFRINILDLTVKELKKHCQSKGLISYFSQTNYTHKQLGMMLTRNFPEKYYIGKKSHHFNRSNEIQQIYGVRKDQTPEYYQQQEGYSDEQESGFINDQVQESNYQESELQQQKQFSDQQEQAPKRKNRNKKKKLIKKTQTSNRTKKDKKTGHQKVGKRKKREQIYFEEQDEQQIKKDDIKLNQTSEKEKKQSRVSFINRSRNIDSD